MPLLGGKNKFKVAPPKIRIEKVPIVEKPKPKRKPIATPSSSTSPPSVSSSSARGGSRPTASPAPSTSSSHLGSRSQSRKRPNDAGDAVSDRRSAPSKRSAVASTRSGASSQSPPQWARDDSDDEGLDGAAGQGDDDFLARLEFAPRGHRSSSGGGAPEKDPRFGKLRDLSAWELPVTPLPGLIHAADVANCETKCVPLWGASEDAGEVSVELQYPSLHPPERYELVWGKDKIDAVSSIISVVRHVASNFLQPPDAAAFTEPHNGLIRRLEKASNRNVQDLAAFKKALSEYNERVRELAQGESIGMRIDKTVSLPRDLVDFILDQVYDRTVAPKVELLSKYENGTDNVYGELLHPFVSKILKGILNMTSDMVFVDLGSGVGNVVLQAALEVGCESWGCEMMENACNLADAQLDDFRARCRMWGLRPGKSFLERGDFRTNTRVHEALKRADVILVNNQAFTSQLNDDLVRMFLDLKSGCKVVSLKTFVHSHKSASYDVGQTILDVKTYSYPEGYVSWTNAGGTYCISTRK